MTVNPFDLKPPTRKAFPGGIADAIAYYEQALEFCRQAQQAFDHAVTLTSECIDGAEHMHRVFSASAELRATVGLDDALLAKVVDFTHVAAPSLLTFMEARSAYTARQLLIEQAIAALRASHDAGDDDCQLCEQEAELEPGTFEPHVCSR